MYLKKKNFQNIFEKKKTKLHISMKLVYMRLRFLAQVCLVMLVCKSVAWLQSCVSVTMVGEKKRKENGKIFLFINFFFVLKKNKNLQSTSQGHNQSPLHFRKMQIYLTADDSLCVLGLFFPALSPASFPLVKMFVRNNQLFLVLQCLRILSWSQDCENELLTLSVDCWKSIKMERNCWSFFFQQCLYFIFLLKCT